MNLTSRSLSELVGSDLEKFIVQDVIDFDLIILAERDEGGSHYEYKLKMKPILEQRGFEVSAPPHELCGYLDLVATKGDYKINGEVGLTPDERVWTHLFEFNEVWVLPYDMFKPYTIYVYKRGRNYWHYQDFIEGYNDLMKVCPKCKKSSFFSASFCCYCGENIESERMVCSKCGQPIEKNR